MSWLNLHTRALAPLHGPSLCEICRAWGDTALCAECVARHAPARLRCTRCGLALAALDGACEACLGDPPPFERCCCVADYGFPWDRLIAELKFHDRSALATALAALMARALQAAEPAHAVDLILPVPLAPQRLAERGYNQAWELARRLGPLLQTSARADVLSRPIATAAQHELGRSERQRNLRGSFMVEPSQRHSLQGRRVALVDDVMTTGATVREASEVLLRAGAAAVEVWVFARTP